MKSKHMKLGGTRIYNSLCFVKIYLVANTNITSCKVGKSRDEPRTTVKNDQRYNSFKNYLVHFISSSHNKKYNNCSTFEGVLMDFYHGIIYMYK